MSLDQALASLPHGPEFRFVDRLTDLAPGQRAAGEYTVRADEPMLKGHFPGSPMLPGVLLIEAGAQLAGIVAQSDPAARTPARLRLTAVRGAKILGTAVPGQTIQLEAEITGRLGPLVQARVTARVDESVILTAEVALSAET